MNISPLGFKRPTHMKKVMCEFLFYLSLTSYSPFQQRSLKDDSKRVSRTMFDVEILGFILVTILILIRYM